MKLLLLCILPVVLAAPHDPKRFLIGALQIENIFDLETLKCDIQILLDVLGRDPTEAACEKECHHIVAEGNTLHHACPLVCQLFQTIATALHEQPKPEQASNPCGGLGR